MRRPSSRKTEEYIPEIRNDRPIPERTTAVYVRKIVEGELIRLVDRIKPGESVDLPVGSMGKFRKLVEQRGYGTVTQRPKADETGTVWVLPSEAS